MFSEIGWVDDSYNFNNETAMADIMSLPDAVRQKIFCNEIVFTQNSVV